MLFRRAVCVSIDGVTIMINVNRKKQTPTIKQAQMCTGTKQPRCCLAVAATAGSLPGAAPSAPRGGMGQDHRPVSSLARPFLTLWNELLRCRICSLPNHAACAPQQRLGRLKGGEHRAPARPTAVPEQAVQNRVKATVTSPKKLSCDLLCLFYT